MPKMKTHSSAKKRFKVTKTGRKVQSGLYAPYANEQTQIDEA